MATITELEDALRNADAAGDADAARMLADEIIRLRQAAPAAAAQPQAAAIEQPTPMAPVRVEPPQAPAAEPAQMQPVSQPQAPAAQQPELPWWTRGLIDLLQAPEGQTLSQAARNELLGLLRGAADIGSTLVEAAHHARRRRCADWHVSRAIPRASAANHCRHG